MADTTAKESRVISLGRPVLGGDVRVERRFYLWIAVVGRSGEGEFLTLPFGQW